MISAWVCGIFGASVTYWVGSRYFGFSALACFLAIVASNIAGFFSLLLTLALERRASIRRVLMGSALRTWVVLAALYVAFLVGMHPGLRSPLALIALLAPLIFATGFMLPLWGPTQDRVIRWEQSRSRRPRFSRNQQFARPERDAIRVES